MNDLLETGLRIRTMREQQRLTREKLAEKANISVQFLADIENGKKGMTLATLKKICTALNLSADYVVFGKGNALDINRRISMLTPEKQKAFLEVISIIIEKLL